MGFVTVTPSMYRSPVFIGLLCVLAVAIVLLLHHFVLVACCNGVDRRRRAGAAASRRDAHQRLHQQRSTVDASSSFSLESSRTHLVKGEAAGVVCPYRKDEEWKEPTCPVCLADFADGEAVRVLPECLHYFHAGCIDTWLRGGSTSCPMCRADATPTPSPTSLQHELSLSVSLEDIMVHR